MRTASGKKGGEDVNPAEALAVKKKIQFAKFEK
jgi:hypothetical protein